ncbi:MAG: DNA topoisomerase IB [Actinobacteria bacterium]|nr:DNA topoisomerase IB [Actinomycetota bacterium]
MSRLRRVECSGAGIVRRRRGRGFEYRDATGNRVDDEVMARIRALAIPPAWTDVWICPDPRGHLQAVGTDAAGRRQYLYHQQWRARRDQEKFDRMLAFARALPRVRRTAERHLHEDGLGRDRVLSCAVRLLDRGFFRVGGEEYAENGTYGLATLERRHVKLDVDGVLVFDYIAKGGKHRVQAVVDPQVYAVVAELKARRGGGRALLAYRNGRWVDVRSSEINDYLKQLAKGEFSAKDFRTWHATVLAAVALAVSTEAKSQTARRRAMSRAVQEVSHYLGNTPAVCRASYIDPRVFDRYLAGVTVAPALGALAEQHDAPATQGRIEAAVLGLLDSA